MKNRILIKEDRNLLNEIVNDLRGYKPTLTALYNGYNGLQLGSFNNEIFKKITKQGLSHLYTKYQANLEAECDKTGVINPILRKTVMSASEPEFEKFRKVYSDLMDYSPTPSRFNPRPMLELENISFNGENFEVSAVDQEIILERNCRIYLQTEAEKSFHSNLSNLQDAFNNYLKDFEKYELAGKVNGFIGFETFFKIDGFKAKIKPESINHAVTVSQKVKKHTADKMTAIRKQTEAKAEVLSKFKAGELPGQLRWNQLNQTDNIVN